jgi:hypothetical protein
VSPIFPQPPGIVGRKFASLASQADGYGNLILTLEDKAAFVEEAPEIFMPHTKSRQFCVRVLFHALKA